MSLNNYPEVASLHLLSLLPCLSNCVSVTDVTFVPVSRVTARVEVDDIIAAVRPNTCLISIMLANNETGVIMVRRRIEAWKPDGLLSVFICSSDDREIIFLWS